MVSPEQQDQREQAARTHGVYAIRDRGEEAMDRPQRGRYAELQEQLRDRQGVLDAMVEQTARMMVMVEAAQSFVAGQANRGTPLGEIALLRALPAFWNSANRALATILAELPDSEKASPEIDRILEVVHAKTERSSGE